MQQFLRFGAELNLILWIASLFLFHGLLYFILGTENWLVVTMTATGTWAIALLLFKAIGRAMVKEEAQ